MARTFRAHLLATVVAVATGAAYSPALGQDPGKSSAGPVEKVTVTAKRNSYRQENTRTATKTDTPLRDVPQSVTVISKELIKDQDMRSMMDVARYVPGVSMGQGEGHRDAPTLRGNSSTADFFVDGVRDDVQYYRDLYNAERIEILKGPNAMIFGRGGGGGVINRVTKRAHWTTLREVTVSGGSYDSWRGAVDLGGALSKDAAVRLNAFYENSDSYRDYVNLERFGINPTASFALSGETEVRVGYEYFDDHRTVDRGVPSQNGRPLRIREGAFFGNPEQSFADTAVHLAYATLEHAFTPELSLRNHAVFADYDKFYQNVHANSAVNGAGNVTLQAYNSGMLRQNVFNQTDLIWETATGPVRHTVLAGVEFGWQDTDNTRAPNNNAAGTVNIANPTTFAPAAILSPLQADNFVETALAAGYLQDQIEISEQFLVIAGIRFDRFDLDFDDRRAANADSSRTDDLVAPRFGAIYKPIESASIYASYSVSYLPQSGDQFGSLDATTAALDPEEFENIEIGLKWDITPALTLTAALYQLDRANTRATDPISSLTVLTGEQRSEGLEFGLAGAITEAWSVMAGVTIQSAEITKTTTAAPAGRAVPLVPEKTFALWNHYRFTEDFAAAVGVTHQSDMFASISNAVVLPAFTRVDAAVYYAVSENIELQVNVENVFDETYWSAAHNDNNITPGSPRAVKATLTTRF